MRIAQARPYNGFVSILDPHPKPATGRSTVLAVAVLLVAICAAIWRTEVAGSRASELAAEVVKVREQIEQTQERRDERLLAVELKASTALNQAEKALGYKKWLASMQFWYRENCGGKIPPEIE